MLVAPALLWLLMAAATGGAAQTNVLQPSPNPLPKFPTFHSGGNPADLKAFDDAMKPVDAAERAAQQCLARGDLSAAERYCQQAIDLSPRSANGKPFALSAVSILGEVKLAQGKPKEALTMFRYCEPEYSNEEMLFSATVAYCRLADYKAALAEYEHAMRFTARPEWLNDDNPDRPGSKNLVEIEASLLLARADRMYIWLPDHGEALLRSAERLRPGNPMIAFKLGKVLRDNGKAADALPRLKRAARAGHGRLSEDAGRLAASMESLSHRPASRVDSAPW